MNLIHGASGSRVCLFLMTVVCLCFIPVSGTGTRKKISDNVASKCINASTAGAAHCILTD